MPADRLARVDVLAERDEGLEEPRLGSEHVVVDVRRHQQRGVGLAERRSRDRFSCEDTLVAQHVGEAARREPMDLRRDVPSAAELGRDHRLPLPLRLADEQPRPRHVDVHAAPVGVPGEHAVDHPAALIRVLDPVHLRPGQAERGSTAGVDVHQDVRTREQLRREKVRELLVGRSVGPAGERAIEVGTRRPEPRVGARRVRREAGDHGHPAGHLLRPQVAREVQGGDLALGLVAVHAPDHERRRALAPRDGDDRDEEARPAARVR